MLDFTKDINFLKPNVNLDFNLLNLDEKFDEENLLSLVANRYKIKKTQIEFFNGYSSAIYSILKFLNLKHCFIYSPIHSEYKSACENLSYDLRMINRFENIFLPIKDKCVVVFMNPSFLDGTYYDLEELIKYWLLKDATIIIDESFLDFCSKQSALKYLSKCEKLYILKSYNNYFGSETLNVSTIFSREENILSLKKYEPSNKLSLFDIKYFEEVLKDLKFSSVSNAIMIKNRFAIEKVLNECEHIEFLFQSSSNSLLIKPKDISSKDLAMKFEKAGIKVLLHGEFINIYLLGQTQIQEFEKIVNAF